MLTSEDSRERSDIVTFGSTVRGVRFDIWALARLWRRPGEPWDEGRVESDGENLTGRYWAGESIVTVNICRGVEARE